MRTLAIKVVLALNLSLVSMSLAQNQKQGGERQEKPHKAQQAVAMHSPMHRPPTLPLYHGEVLKVPHPVYRHEPQPMIQRPAAPRPMPPAAPRPAPPARPAPTTPKPAQSITPARPIAVTPRPHPPKRIYPLPRQDEGGKRITARPITSPTKHVEIVRQTVANQNMATVVSTISSSPSDRDGRFHWYKRNGVRFCHRYDQDRDRHWFGFYQDDVFFWTIYYHQCFWWREESRRRWLAFWRDHWWWYSPQGVYYIYIDDQYYQWNHTPDSVVLMPVESQEPQATNTAIEDTGGTLGTGVDTLIVSRAPIYHYAADGTRMVQVEGQELSAYLYDNTKQTEDGPRLIRYLTEGVTDVHFSDPSSGAPLQIILSVQNADGSIRHVALDANGNLLSAGTAGGSLEAPSAQIAYGTPGAPGFDAPGGDLPPTDSPMPDGQ